MNKLKKYFGPSTLIAAAFIGPGTLTTCTIVGVQTTYNLLWVMLFAIVATIILQEMSARLGFATQQGLGEALNRQFSKGITRYLVFFLVTGAIIVGNAAYEAGNIAGAVLGLDLLLGQWKGWPLFIGIICFLLMYIGKYKWIERILIALVLIMSFCFLLTATIVQPNLVEIAKGFIPKTTPNTNILLILAVIGTTIVPYNLFLHASTISKKWKSEDVLKDLRIENAVAIILGGIISMLIIITAASSQTNVESIQSAKDLAIQLAPVFGSASKWLMGIGLMAAGISSALTAPLAAAYAAKGLFNWGDQENNFKFVAVWLLILLIGVVVSFTNIKPISIIKFAQITNAILLPCIAIYLLYLCNVSKIMGRYTNGFIANLFGGAVVIITVLLSLRSIKLLFNF